MSINDPKYKFENDRIINEASGEPVPTDEPCMVFRARDVHAETAIAHYISSFVHDTQVPTSHVQSDREKLLKEAHQKAFDPSYGANDESAFESYRDAFIAALEAAGVRMVPVETTEEMKRAARVRPHKKLSTKKTGDMYADVFSAMIAASPYAPGETGSE